MIFIGFATSDAYDPTFKVIVVFLAAVGVILTPIYLLSNLREIFYGPENKELIAHEVLQDAEPREIFIVACLLVPMIGIGLYPKMLTQIYDSTTSQLTARLRDSVPGLTQPVVAKNDMPAVLMQAPMIGVSKVLTEAQ
jgi:NAD(P)H-quinone oxidoreductase subunit 4